MFIEIIWSLLELNVYTCVDFKNVHWFSLLCVLFIDKVLDLAMGNKVKMSEVKNKDEISLYRGTKLCPRTKIWKNYFWNDVAQELHVIRQTLTVKFAI